MISYIRGFIEYKGDDHIIIEASGIGYEIFMSSSSMAMLPGEGQDIKVLIHHHVKEDEETLYGFMDMEEKILFRHLISVSGIGPKGAMKMLSQSSYLLIIDAVQNGDVRFLTSLSGIGKKTAERLVLELKGTLIRPEMEGKNIRGDIRSGQEAVEALVSLQFPASKVRAVVHDIMAQGNSVDTKDIIKEALKYLGK